MMIMMFQVWFIKLLRSELYSGYSLVFVSYYKIYSLAVYYFQVAALEELITFLLCGIMG